MAPPHSLRMFRSKSIAVTQQVIIFSLQQEQFALPLALVVKVMAVDHLYAQVGGSETALAFAQNQDIPVIAIHQRIFGSSKGRLGNLSGVEGDRPALASSSEQIVARFLLLVYDMYGELIGLPLDSPPALRRVPESAFKPISTTYQNTGSIRCLAGLIVLQPDSRPIFLLNLAQLLQPQHALSSGRSSGT